MKNKLEGILHPPSIYDLQVSVAHRKPKYSINGCSGPSNFIGAATIASPKVYVVANDDLGGSVVYVGVTMRSMGARFKDGFRAIMDDDTKTYSWALSNNSYKLFVWDLRDFAAAKSTLEAIEAELTFSVRVMQCAWPIGQKSITFYYFMNAKHTRIAAPISIAMVDQYFDALLQRDWLSTDDRQLLESERTKVINSLRSLALFA